MYSKWILITTVTLSLLGYSSGLQATSESHVDPLVAHFHVGFGVGGHHSYSYYPDQYQYRAYYPYSSYTYYPYQYTASYPYYPYQSTYYPYNESYFNTYPYSNYNYYYPNRGHNYYYYQR